MIWKKIANLGLIFVIFEIVTLAFVPFKAKAENRTFKVTATVLEQLTYLKNGNHLTCSTNCQQGYSILKGEQGFILVVNF